MRKADHVADRRSRPLRLAIRVIIPLLFAGLLWHLFTNVVRFGTVDSESMTPTLEPGDYYTIRLDAYSNGRSPQRGDIIVFDRPDEGAFVKRIIAVGGDLVGIANGRVWLNGSWLKEPYLKEQPMAELPLATEIPKDHLFILGDNRNTSEDSRDYGPIPLSSVIGQVRKVVWPLARAQQLAPVIEEDGGSGTSSR